MRKTNPNQISPMAQIVTRTLKKGTDTGKLNRAEVRAVTAAITEGRTADVLTGRVLEQFRAAGKSKRGGKYVPYERSAAVHKAVANALKKGTAARGKK